MIYILLVVVTILGVVLESTLFCGRVLHFFRPDCALGVVIFSGLYLPRSSGLFLAFLIGYLADALSGAPEGWNTFFMTLVFFFANGLGSQIFLGGIWARILTIVFFTILKGPYLLVALRVEGYHVSLSQSLLVQWIGEALATGIFTLLLFHLMHRIQGMRFFFSILKQRHSST